AAALRRHLEAIAQLGCDPVVVGDRTVARVELVFEQRKNLDAEPVSTTVKVDCGGGARAGRRGGASVVGDRTVARVELVFEQRKNLDAEPVSTTVKVDCGG